MASAQDNNIVIECSPYGDSETEIVNLKTPSFELIPMGNILDFGNSINIFIGLSFLIGLCLFFLFIVIRIRSYVKDNDSSFQDKLTKSSLNGAYLVLFIIGLFLFFTQSGKNDFITIVYAIFGSLMVFALILRFAQKYNEQDSNKLINEVVNVFLPGFMIHEWTYNIAVFVFFLILCIIIMFLASISSKLEEVFSFKNFLGAYCLFQGLNYWYINSSYSNGEGNGADGEETKIDN